MESFAEEEKQPLSGNAPPTLFKMADFTEILTRAQGNFMHTESKYKRAKLTPQQDHELLIQLFEDVQESIIDLVGSEAFDDIIFRMRNKRLEAIQQPISTLNKVSRKDISKIVSAANSSMKSFFTEKLLGKTDKNNVFTVLTSVKEGIKSHIDSSNQ